MLDLAKQYNKTCIWVYVLHMTINHSNTDEICDDLFWKQNKQIHLYFTIKFTSTFSFSCDALIPSICNEVNLQSLVKR